MAKVSDEAGAVLYMFAGQTLVITVTSTQKCAVSHYFKHMTPSSGFHFPSLGKEHQKQYFSTLLRQQSRHHDEGHLHWALESGDKRSVAVVGAGGRSRLQSGLYSAQAAATQDCGGTSTAKQPRVSREAGKWIIR